jgi:hypothetical protein
MAFLTDGYSTLVRFDKAPAVLFRQKEVQPPGLDSGGPIETTTMGTMRFRTNWPKSLITITEMTLQVQWDPIVYTTIVQLLMGPAGVGYIRVQLPDGNRFNFIGFLDKFTPSQHKEGDFALAEAKIVPSLQLVSGGGDFSPFLDIGGTLDPTANGAVRTF